MGKDDFTSELLSIIAADDAVSCAIYARNNNLLRLDGNCIARRDQKLPWMIT